MKKNVFLLTLLFFLFTGFMQSQTIFKPNFSLKSHETLEIEKIELNTRSAVIYLTIENRIENGSFCADKNLFIVYPDGNRSKMTSSKGIPECPDTHKFKTIGERLEFTLTFPPLKPGTEWIDLIEDCSENCFSFYGITLDQNLNNRIEEAFSKNAVSDPVSAMNDFIRIIEDTDKKNLGSEALIYMNIINLALKAGNSGKAAEWYNRFKLSGAPRVSEYIKFLNNQGIKF